MNIAPLEIENTAPRKIENTAPLEIENTTPFKTENNGTSVFEKMAPFEFCLEIWVQLLGAETPL